MKVICLQWKKDREIAPVTKRLKDDYLSKHSCDIIALCTAIRAISREASSRYQKRGGKNLLLLHFLVGIKSVYLGALPGYSSLALFLTCRDVDWLLRATIAFLS